MRLIDADEAVRAVHDEFDECLVWDESGETTANEVENIILQIPTVDPVKHGHWSHIGGDEWCCSNCGFVVVTEGSWEHPKERGYDYCYHCGAKMDEVEDDAK